MKTFSQYLKEARFQEIIHKNPSISTLKNLAKNNKYGSARFVIYKNDEDGYVAGDSEKFTHHDIAPAIGSWHTRGYIQHLKDNDYAYRTMEPYSNLPSDHPLLRKFEKHGIQNGNS